MKTFKVRFRRRTINDTTGISYLNASNTLKERIVRENPELKNFLALPGWVLYEDIYISQNVGEARIIVPANFREHYKVFQDQYSHTF